MKKKTLLSLGAAGVLLASGLGVATAIAHEDGYRSGNHDDRHVGRHGGHGMFQRIDADDNVVWDYLFYDYGFLQHHDIQPMPNGNVLVVAWERRTLAEGIQAVEVRSDQPCGQVQEVEDEEAQDEEATQQHQPGGKVAGQVRAAPVSDGAGGAVVPRQPHRGKDVHGEEREQREAESPQQRMALHPGGIGVERIGSLQDDEVACHVCQQEAEQQHAGSSHHQLAADGGSE